MKNANTSDFSELVDAYKKNVPIKISEIEGLWRSVQSNFSSQELTLLYQKIHNLQGSAGIYGFVKLSDAAKNVSLALKSILNATSITKEQQIQLNQLLNELILKSSVHEMNFNVPAVEQVNIIQSGKVIYLMETDSEWSASLIKQITAFGYEIQQFKSFDSMLATMKQNKPLALLVNIDILNDEIKSTYDDFKFKTQDIPVIFITTKTEFNLRLTAVRLGGIAYLVKPFQIEELTAVLNRLSFSVNKKFKILIIDDEVEVTRYLAKILQTANLETKEVSIATDVQQALHEFNPDLILLDLYMPNCTGFELASVIRQQNKYESVPIIFLSSEEDKQKQLDAMRSGADDFIIKTASPEYLILAIKNRINRYQIQSDLMIKDSLTGAFNYSFILEQLNNELAKAKNIGAPLTIAVMGIDNFKNILDRFGYLAGDQVIKNLSFMLRSRLNGHIIIGCFAGEKFLIIFPNADEEKTKKLVDDVRTNFQSVLFSWEYQLFNSTVSSGIAGYPSFNSSKDLVDAAETALSNAKKQGRNSIIVANEKRN